MIVLLLSSIHNNVSVQREKYIMVGGQVYFLWKLRLSNISAYLYRFSKFPVLVINQVLYTCERKMLFRDKENHIT